MGLDMYLHAKHYVKNWEILPASERYTVTVAKGGEALPHVKPERIKYVEEEIGYWRKANAIHKWFVDNTQQGIDECQESYVDENDIRTLQQACRDVLEDRGKAADLLPAASGFFFGSTEYDDWYFKDLEETIAICDEALASIKGGASIYYHASW